MTSHCTCGTQLVEDAAFCHRCGKAQREFVAEPEEALAIPVEAARQPAVNEPVTFSNAAAIRVSFLAASVASMLDALPLVDALFLLWSVLAGYFSVQLYQRRTGQVLSVRSGAKMGWITGILNALIVLVFATIAFATQYEQQLALMQTKDPSNFARIATLMHNPITVAAALVLFALLLFALFALASLAGGALSAKVARKS